MSKIVMKLDELSCPSCMAKIEGALNTTNGVEMAKVLFNASKVKAEFNDNQVTATEGLGYVVQKSKVTEI